MILPLLLPLVVQIQTIPTFVVKLGHTVINTCCITIFISVIAICSNVIEYCFQDSKSEIMTPVYIMHSFFTGMIVFSFLGIAGVVKSKGVLVQVSFFIWLLLMIMWLALVCILYASWYSTPDICTNHRCPESLWLSDFYFRAFKEVPNNKTAPLGPKENVTSNANNTFPGQGNSTDDVHFEKDLLYLTLSTTSFLSFIIFFTMLGSMIYNYYEALMVFGDGMDVPRIIPPAAYVFVLPFRQYYEPVSSEPSTSTGPGTSQGESKKTETAADNKPTSGPSTNISPTPKKPAPTSSNAQTKNAGKS